MADVATVEHEGGELSARDRAQAEHYTRFTVEETETKRGDSQASRFLADNRERYGNSRVHEPTTLFADLRDFATANINDILDSKDESQAAKAKLKNFSEVHKSMIALLAREEIKDDEQWRQIKDFIIDSDKEDLGRNRAIFLEFLSIIPKHLITPEEARYMSPPEKEARPEPTYMGPPIEEEHNDGNPHPVKAKAVLQEIAKAGDPTYEKLYAFCDVLLEDLADQETLFGEADPSMDPGEEGSQAPQERAYVERLRELFEKVENHEPLILNETRGSYVDEYWNIVQLVERYAGKRTSESTMIIEFINKNKIVKKEKQPGVIKRFLKNGLPIGKGRKKKED